MNTVMKTLHDLDVQVQCSPFKRGVAIVFVAVIMFVAAQAIMDHVRNDMYNCVCEDGVATER